MLLAPLTSVKHSIALTTDEGPCKSPPFACLPPDHPAEPPSDPTRNWIRIGGNVRRHRSPHPSIEFLRHALTVVAPPGPHCATRAPWLPFRHKQQLHIKGGPPPCYPVVNSQQASV